MKTFKTEADANEYARCHNVGLWGRNDWLVLVDGPGDGEITVMSVGEAIENDFPYRWSA